MINSSIKKITFGLVVILLVISGVSFFRSININKSLSIAEQQIEEPILVLTIDDLPDSEPLIPSEEFNKLHIYRAIEGQSSVIWKGARLDGVEHTGTFPIISGELFVNDEKVIRTGVFILDVANTTSDNSAVLARLVSEEFFQTDIYPESEFTITKVLHDDTSSTFIITGDLAIKGVVNRIELPASIIFTDNTTIKVQAEYILDRTLWDITTDSPKFFTNLADQAIKDEVGISIDLVFEQNNE